MQTLLDYWVQKLIVIVILNSFEHSNSLPHFWKLAFLPRFSIKHRSSKKCCILCCLIRVAWVLTTPNTSLSFLFHSLLISWKFGCNVLRKIGFVHWIFSMLVRFLTRYRYSTRFSIPLLVEILVVNEFSYLELVLNLFRS